MKKLFYLLSLIWMLSCSSVVQNGSEKVVALIYPVHPVPQDEKYMLYNKKYIFSFVDTDGNQYVTSWSAVAGEDYDGERFNNVTKKCSQYVYSLYPRDLVNLAPVSESELSYKNIAACIVKEGYKLENGRAHSPEEIIVILGKEYVSHGKSVKAGGRVRINSMKLQVSEILPSVQDCYKESSKEYLQGEVAALIYINMEPVINRFAACMRNKNFEVIETRKDF